MFLDYTFEMSLKAAEYGQLFLLAFCRSVVKIMTASIVLRPLLKPYCSGPNIELASTMLVIFSHIRMVIKRRRLDGIVIGRYWAGLRDSPPWKSNIIFQCYTLILIYLEYKNHLADIQVRRNSASGNDVVDEYKQVLFEQRTGVTDKLIADHIIPA